MKLFLVTGLWISLALSPCDTVVAGLVGHQPIDIELDRNGSLVGVIRPIGPQRVAVFRGRQLVAQAAATEGNFLICDLQGGLYWVVARRGGQVIRAWDHGTAPPLSSQYVVLPDTDSVVHHVSVTRGQSSTDQLVQSLPAPSLPFHPHPGPGTGMIMPGPYVPPGALFIDPLVTAAVVTGVGGVVIVTIDGNDDGAQSGLNWTQDGPPASP